VPPFPSLQRLSGDDRRRRAERAQDLVAVLAEQDVVAVATSFVDNSGISRVKSVPLARLPQLAAWGVGFSTAFDYFRFDDWVAAPAGGTGPVGDQRIVPDLSRIAVLSAQPGWAWAPGDRFDQDGTAYPHDSRLLLRRHVTALAERGVEVTRSLPPPPARPTACRAGSTPRRTPATS
jgi:glutamine synthetase